MESVSGSQRLAIVGAGAMGGTIGASLLRAGHDVTLVDSDEQHINAIRAAGLRIEGPLTEFTVAAPAFLPSEVQGRFDTILLCVKALNTDDAITGLLPFLAEDGCVVSVQNGLNEMLIAQRIGAGRTVGCFVNFGADRTAPGVIHYGGRGALVLGELDGGDTPRLRRLRDVLADFDPDVVTTGNIWGYLWAKLAVGAMIFATALTDDGIADCYARPEHRDLFVAIAREVLNVAAAHGITPEPFDGFEPDAFSPWAERQATDASLAEMVSFNRRSAKTHSGVWRDLRVLRRRTEAGEHLGAIAAVAASVGQPTPLVGGIHRMINEIEEGRRQCSQANLDELAGAVLR